MKVLLSIIVILLAGACSDPHVNHICQDNTKRRPCTSDEKNMIDDMRTIIRSVANFDSNNLDKKFNTTSKGIDGARVVIFGENHLEIIGMMETLGALNALAKNGDVVLLEGADRKKAAVVECGLHLIFNIYEAWQWEKLGLDYNPALKAEWYATKKLGALFHSTKASYDLSGLTIKHVRCGFWDDAKALQEGLTSGINYNVLKKQNLSMFYAIEENLKDLPAKNNIFVNTGYFHMPLGEVLDFIKKNSGHASTEFSVDDFYALVKAEKEKPLASRTVIIDDFSGNSRVLYKNLQRKSIPYVEMIHGRVFRHYR